MIHKVLFLIALMCTILTGCGSPPHVEIHPTPVKLDNVEHWKIEWEANPEDSTRLTDVTESIVAQSKYNMEETGREFVNKVRLKLLRDYGVSMADNFPMTGTIKVRIIGSHFSDTTINKDSHPHEAELERKLDQPLNDDRYIAMADDSVRATVHLSGRDFVKRAEVFIYNPQGELTHSIVIGGHDSKKVEADFIAKTISKLLKENR